jgi:hypothetical protein
MYVKRRYRRRSLSNNIAKTVPSKYPDMTGIVASGSQRACRNLFKEAVAFAKAINNDPEKKESYRKKIKKGNSVCRSSIKQYIANQRAVLKELDL